MDHGACTKPDTHRLCQAHQVHLQLSDNYHSNDADKRLPTGKVSVLLAKSQRKSEKTTLSRPRGPGIRSQAHWHISEHLPTGHIMRTLLPRDKERLISP